MDTQNIDLAGINLSPWHLVWTTAVTLIVSHLVANYLKDNTPRGYWFWFTIVNLVVGFLLM